MPFDPTATFDLEEETKFDPAKSFSVEPESKFDPSAKFEIEPTPRAAAPAFVSNTPGEAMARAMQIRPGQIDTREVFKPFIPINNPFSVEDETLHHMVQQVPGLERLRAEGERMVDAIIKPIETMESPGGVLLAATAPVPGLGVGLGVGLGSQMVVQGTKELIQGVREGSPSKLLSGAIQTTLGAAPIVGVAAKPVAGGLAAMAARGAEDLASNPPPVISGEAPPLAAPAEPAVSPAVAPGVAAPGTAPAISDATTEVSARQPAQVGASLETDLETVLRRLPPEIRNEVGTPKISVINFPSDMEGSGAVYRSGRVFYEAGEPVNLDTIEHEVLHAYVLKHPELFDENNPFGMEKAVDTLQARLKAERGQASTPASASSAAVANASDSLSSVKPIAEQLTLPITGELGPGDLSGPGGAATPEEFPANANPDIYGVSQAAREARAAAGTGPQIEPGTGIAAEASIQRGREMLANGADPEAILRQFEATGRVSGDDAALARAHGERLAQAMREAESAHGTDSPEFRAARDELFAWDTRTKAMATEAHKQFQALQGATDIDTGDFVSLERAHRDATGDAFTPKQSAQAQEIATDVQGKQGDVAAAQTDLLNEIDKASVEPQAPAAKKTVKRPAPMTDADKVALQHANDVVRNNAARIAELERRKGVEDAQRDLEIRRLEEATKARVASAATERAKAAAIKEAKAERASIEARAKAAKELAEVDRRAQERALDAAAKVVRNNAVRVAQEARADFEARADLPRYVWERAKRYVEGGEKNLDKIAQAVANDIGVPKKDVMTAMGRNRGRIKALSDDMYVKMSRARQAEAAARAWLIDQRYPGWVRYARKIPGAAFTAKTFGHGSVGMVTHAGALMFDPRVADLYWKNFAKQYPLMFKRGFHEAAMQNLVGNKNWKTANRAGLINDPARFVDDYQAGQMAGVVTGLGNRGFDVLKLMRQDLFDRAWDALHPHQRSPEAAKLLALEINHSTGGVSGAFLGKFDRAASLTFFAPKLEASRWAFAFGDPAKALTIGLKWFDASPAERMFALRQLKQKSAMVGTYISLLSVNQALHNAFGSKQNVNFGDVSSPGDLWAFKAFGQQFSVISPMIHMVSFLANMMRISGLIGDRTKSQRREDRASEMAAKAEEYARGKLSPFAAPIVDLATQETFQKRPMPFSDDRVPAYRRRMGLEAYTWPEYLTQQFSPIPVSESIREVWESQGMTPNDATRYLKALEVGFVTGATGIRVSEDRGK